MSLVLKLLNVSNQICLNNLKIHFKDKVYLTRRQKIAEFLLVCKVQKFTSEVKHTPQTNVLHSPQGQSTVFHFQHLSNHRLHQHY